MAESCWNFVAATNSHGIFNQCRTHWCLVIGRENYAFLDHLLVFVFVIFVYIVLIDLVLIWKTKQQPSRRNDNDIVIMHYNDVIIGAMASQIFSLTIVYSIVYSGAEKNQSSASLTFVRGIHRWPVNSLHKWPVTRKWFHLIMDWVVRVVYRDRW